VPDHLGMPAPLPSLVTAAQVTTQPRRGTPVLNAAFYKPALLARDVGQQGSTCQWPVGSRPRRWVRGADSYRLAHVCAQRTTTNPARDTMSQ
jgi:hypothetical protein